LGLKGGYGGGKRSEGYITYQKCCDVAMSCDLVKLPAVLDDVGVRCVSRRLDKMLVLDGEKEKKRGKKVLMVGEE
jgi:hypothetical protein